MSLIAAAPGRYQLGHSLWRKLPQGVSKVVTGQCFKMRRAASWVKAACASPDASPLLQELPESVLVDVS